MNIKLIKAIGFGATLLGAGATLLASWANDRQQEALIDEKVTTRVNEVLAPVVASAEVVEHAIEVATDETV